MTPTWTPFFLLLLLLPLPSTTQTTPVSPAAKDDSICLSEILISTPQPYDSAQVADAQQKADSAREAIQQGAKFEDIARKVSDGPSASIGGALGRFKRGLLAKVIEDKVLALKSGEVSDVVRTKQGYVILKVRECGGALRANPSSGSIDILSDTQGVDFGPYLQRILQNVKENWYHLIPASAQMKKGKLAIEFAIMKDGKVADMRLVASSGEVDLDRPAWGSITASNPFPPLPGEFTGPYFTLRFRFIYNSYLNPITVSISTPRSLEEVPLGSAKPITIVVTGTGTKENAVEWTVTGSGCSGAACGEMTTDSYVAPTVMPNSPWVTLTAVSKADPTAKDSVTLHIVQPAAQTSSKP